MNHRINTVSVSPLESLSPSGLLRVRLTMPCMPSDCLLPIPGDLRYWGGCEFLVNPPEDSPCDYWIVLGNAQVKESAWVSPENTLFICGEPPAKKHYPRRFYGQFHRVIDTHGWSRHPRLELHAPCLGWGVGGEYDRFADLKRPAKINRVGVVCSSSAKTPGQRRRLRFLAALKKRLGDRIAHFGRGFQPLEQKLDGILPYRFQLVLENSISNHYWTEKLADAYLGWGFPIYAGCPNLEQYFDPAEFHRIDLEKPDEAAELISKLLSISETDAEIQSVESGRNRVLHDYNLLFRCATLAKRYFQPSARRQVVIRYYKDFQKRRTFQHFFRIFTEGFTHDR